MHLTKIYAFTASVNKKTVVPDLPIISVSQPHNLRRSLCRVKLRQPAGVNDEPPRLSQSCGKSHCKLCLSLICSNYITSTANNKTFQCHNENTSCDSKCIIYVISCPICKLHTWAKLITLELARMDKKVTSDSTPLIRLIRWTTSFYMII